MANSNWFKTGQLEDFNLWLVTFNQPSCVIDGFLLHFFDISWYVFTKCLLSIILETGPKIIYRIKVEPMSYHHEAWSKRPHHGLVILTKFHGDSSKIVDFFVVGQILILCNFFFWSILFCFNMVKKVSENFKNISVWIIKSSNKNYNSSFAKQKSANHHTAILQTPNLSIDFT